MSVVPGTDHLTEQEWADAVTTSFLENNPPRYDGDFQSWAASLLTVRPFVGKPLPRPELFTEWKTWAKIVQGIMET